jgi:hypothetical protein
MQFTFPNGRPLSVPFSGCLLFSKKREPSPFSKKQYAGVGLQQVMHNQAY